MAVTLADYREMFTEHASVSDADVSRCITWANSDVSGEYIGHKVDRARLFYAAHYVQSDYATTNDGKPNDAGPITSKSVDGFSVSFGQTGSGGSLATSQFNSTSYGQRYLEIVRRSVGPVVL